MLHELVIHTVFTVNLLKSITFSLKDMLCSVKDKGLINFNVCASETWLLNQ